MEGLFDLHRNGLFDILSEGKNNNNTYRYSINRYSIHQLVDRPAGVYSIRGRLLCKALHLLLIAIDINRQVRIPIGQTIGIDRHFHVTVGHSKRYRSTVSDNYYCKNNIFQLLVEEIGLIRQIHTPILIENNSLLYKFILAYLSKQWVSIDKSAYLSKVSIGIHMQYPNTLTFNRHIQ